jgi:hypothetical protein
VYGVCSSFCVHFWLICQYLVDMSKRIIVWTFCEVVCAFGRGLGGWYCGLLALGAKQDCNRRWDIL